MSILFKNAKILILKNEKLDILNDAGLIVSGKNIKKIFTKEDKNYKKLLDSSYERVIDCKGNLLMPTFKNCHAHSPMTFLRSMRDDLPLREWLFENNFPKEALLTDDDVYWYTYIAILEYLASGIGLSVDMYAHKDAFVSAFRDAGFRVIISHDFDERNIDPNVIEEDYIKYNNLKGKNADLVSARFGVHSEYLNNDNTIKKVAEIVHRYKKPFYAHICETKLETDECIARHKMTPVEYFDKFGLLDYGGAGYHSVWLSENDMDIYKKKNFYAVLNLGSNVKLASGTINLPLMFKKGLNMAMGTDGAASNNNLNFFKEMFLASSVPKLNSEDKDLTSYKAEEILKIATINGARCFDMPEIESLGEGKKADLTMIDLSLPCMQPINNIIANIVYSGSISCVKLTMINGKILYENGKYFVGETPYEIYKKAEYYKQKLLAKL